MAKVKSMSDGKSTIKVGEKIYYCLCDSGYGEWCDNYDPEYETEKPSWEVQTYIVRTIQKRKNTETLTAFLVQANEFTYKNGKFLDPINKFYKMSWPVYNLSDHMKRYGKKKSSAIKKALYDFQYNTRITLSSKYYPESKEHKRFISSMKAGYSRNRNKGQ